MNDRLIDSAYLPQFLGSPFREDPSDHLGISEKNVVVPVAACARYPQPLSGPPNQGFAVTEEVHIEKYSTCSKVVRQGNRENSDYGGLSFALSGDD